MQSQKTLMLAEWQMLCCEWQTSSWDSMCVHDKACRLMERLEDRMTRLGKLHDVQAIHGPNGFPSRLPVTLSGDVIEQKHQLQQTANTMAIAAVRAATISRTPCATCSA